MTTPREPLLRRLSRMLVLGFLVLAAVVLTAGGSYAWTRLAAQERQLTALRDRWQQVQQDAAAVQREAGALGERLRAAEAEAQRLRDENTRLGTENRGLRQQLAQRGENLRELYR
jgi:septal ring factor EnvC (AmiA/AmiB activator)